jgi:transposase-like protein
VKVTYWGNFGRGEDDSQKRHATIRTKFATQLFQYAKRRIDAFAGKYRAKYGRAVECLTKDTEALLAFYDFPAEHWDHLRMTNPIESVFATVRQRTVRTKGSSGISPA